MSISAIDLFCGAGGLTHGLEKAGLNVICGYDIDPDCQFSYDTNNNSTFIRESVAELSSKEICNAFVPGTVSLLAGCAPCQPFSKYTQGKARDERWGLLAHFQRLIKEVLPDLVTMENVPELMKHDIHDDFICTLIENGYHVWSKVVRCQEYGLAQKRCRLVLLASRRGQIELLPPSKDLKNDRIVKDEIFDLPVLKAGQQNHSDPLHRAAGLSAINLKRIQSSRPNGSWKDWPNDLLTECHKKISGKGYTAVYGRMSWDGPAPTITTQSYNYGSGRFGHPDQDRAITLREAACLQSFPFDYRFIKNTEYSMGAVAKLIGNAVPPLLGNVIGKSILAHVN